MPTLLQRTMLEGLNSMAKAGARWLKLLGQQLNRILTLSPH
jgi:hypothetical protein